jgi:hypothetical protein
MTDQMTWTKLALLLFVISGTIQLGMLVQAASRIESQLKQIAARLDTLLKDRQK